jgi:hypothetical protein
MFYYYSKVMPAKSGSQFYLTKSSIGDYSIIHILADFAESAYLFKYLQICNLRAVGKVGMRIKEPMG